MPKNDDILSSVGNEIKTNPPSILKQTAQKYGVARAQKQKSAILLSKARKMGAKLPYKGA